MAKVNDKSKSRTAAAKKERKGTGLAVSTKRNIIRITGFMVGVFALFSLMSVLSYLFTWKADQSLLFEKNMLDQSVGVHNWGGKFGFRWADFLVGRCLGLGSFSVVVIFSIWAYRLIYPTRRFKLGRYTMLSLTSAPVLSWIFAYVGIVFGVDTVLSGGLGGAAGSAFVNSLINLFGIVVTGITVILVAVIWLLFASGRFAAWFAPRDKRVDNTLPAIETEVESEAANSDGDASMSNVANSDGDASMSNVIDPDGDASMSNEEADEENAGGEAYMSDMESGLDGSECYGGLGSDQDDDAAGSINGDAGAGVGGSYGNGVGRSYGNGQGLGTADGEESFGETEVDSDVSGGAQTAGDYNAEGHNGSDGVGTESGFTVVNDGEALGDGPVAELERIDNRKELSEYVFPPIDLLDDYANGQNEVSSLELARNNQMIVSTLLAYKIKVLNVEAVVGPTVTLYRVYPAPGVKYSQIRNISEDIARALNVRAVRVVNLDGAVGIEVANRNPSIVPLKKMLNDPSFRESKGDLPVAIGYITRTQKVKTFDLADAPHLIVAGATKQGKSVCLNVLIASLLYAKHPSELKLVFVDPKMVEFTVYKSLLKHYLAILPNAVSDKEEEDSAIVKEPKQAEKVLASLCVEMDERFEMLMKAGVNNIDSYNEKYRNRYLRPDEGHHFLPFIVVIIDEFADLLSTGVGPESKATSRSINTSIKRLAQKGRAAGIHVILATQRPSVSVITGEIKANFPARIAFRVSSRVDSMTILDAPGAETLIGKGDMLFSSGIDPERIQCALIDMQEIKKITDFIHAENGYKQCYVHPYYLPAPPSESSDASVPGSIDMTNIDPLFEDAARMIVTNQRGSTSDLQRRMGMGYARAGRVMDQLEAAGIVGPQEGAKPRQVLVSDFAELEPIIAAFCHKS